MAKARKAPATPSAIPPASPATAAPAPAATPTPKKKKTTKKKPSHPGYATMVSNALTTIPSNFHGITRFAIKKFLKDTYGLEPKRSFVTRALHAGVAQGVFVMVGVRYKLDPQYRLAVKKQADRKAKKAEKAQGASAKKKKSTKKKTTTTKKAAEGTTEEKKKATKKKSTTKKATSEKKKKSTTTTKKTTKKKSEKKEEGEEAAEKPKRGRKKGTTNAATAAKKGAKATTAAAKKKAEKTKTGKAKKTTKKAAATEEKKGTKGKRGPKKATEEKPATKGKRGPKPKAATAKKAPAKRAKKSESAPVAKRAKSAEVAPLLRRADSIHVLPQSGLSGEVYRAGLVVFEANLAVVNIDTDTDQFFKLQIVKTPDDKYHLVTVSGRTGSRGECDVKQYESADAAIAAFEEVFVDKTGATWADRHSYVAADGKYSLAKKDHNRVQQGEVMWKYYMDNGVDGKVTGWYDYDKEASEHVEATYQEFKMNKAWLTVRSIKSGHFSYHVNFSNMTQTNLSTKKTDRKSVV